MPTTHKGTTKVLDELLAIFDAVTTASWTASTHDGTVGVDMDLTAKDEVDPGEIIVKWPGIVGGASSTISFLVEDSADNSSFSTIRTLPVVDTDGSGIYNPAEVTIAIPKDRRRYIRLSVIVGTAALTSGSGPITAHVSKGPSGGGYI